MGTTQQASGEGLFPLLQQAFGVRVPLSIGFWGPGSPFNRFLGSGFPFQQVFGVRVPLSTGFRGPGSPAYTLLGSGFPYCAFLLPFTVGSQFRAKCIRHREVVSSSLCCTEFSNCNDIQRGDKTISLNQDESHLPSAVIRPF